MAFICLFVLVFDHCVDERQRTNDPRGGEYIGSAKCITCHEAIYNSYASTAHNLSSQVASAETIKGSFHKDSNTLFYRPAMRVVMERRDSGFYQAAYIDGIERRSARFEGVIGSGRKGQSFIYWLGDQIYQLPVSYYVPGRAWVNSPSFPPKIVKFDRDISVGCFECHGSYIKKTATTSAGNDLIDHYDKSQIIYGIDCERCHGPAAKHVNFHVNNPKETKPGFIVTAGSLSRQQKLDMCAICHSGSRQTRISPFYYKPGDQLSRYLYPDTSVLSPANIDVHGKQYQTLTASQCFIKSATLTCSSCHNIHVRERDDLAGFSAKCMKCHNNVSHDFGKRAATVTAVYPTTCIDCHLPAKPSALITMRSKADTAPVQAFVRTHYISIHRDEPKRLLKKDSMY